MLAAGLPRDALDHQHGGWTKFVQYLRSLHWLIRKCNKFHSVTWKFRQRPQSISPNNENSVPEVSLRHCCHTVMKRELWQRKRRTKVHPPAARSWGRASSHSSLLISKPSLLLPRATFFYPRLCHHACFRYYPGHHLRCHSRRHLRYYFKYFSSSTMLQSFTFRVWRVLTSATSRSYIDLLVPLSFLERTWIVFNYLRNPIVGRFRATMRWLRARDFE